MLKILGLDHVQITVPVGAEPAAKEFYAGVLGLLEIEKPEALKPRGGFWVQAGDRQIHIGVEDGVDRSKTKAHIAFEVDNLEEARAKLEANASKILESVAIPGMDRL